MRRIRRVLLPMLLIGVGITMLAGCFYIPWSDKVPPGERDAGQYLGEADSDRPLRVGEATKQDVLRVAGYPNGGGGNSWVYEWSAQNGGWFQPLCFRIDPAWRDYTLTVEFGSNGRIKRFYV